MIYGFSKRKNPFETLLLGNRDQNFLKMHFFFAYKMQQNLNKLIKQIAYFYNIHCKKNL